MFFNSIFSGIDTRENVIFLASIIMKKGIAHLSKLDSIPVNEDWYEAGRIRDKIELTTLLKEYRHTVKLFGRYVHFSIPTQHIILRKVDHLPDLAEKDLADLLKFELGESIHLPFETPIYDFVKIGTDVLLIATSRELAADMSKSMHDAGLKPLSAEIRATALQRLIHFLQPDWLKELEMILDINEDTVELHIYHQRTIAFSHSIAISKSSYINTSISNEEAFFAWDKVAAVRELEEVTKSSRLDFHKQKKQWNEMMYVDDLLKEIERAQNFYHYTLKETEQVFTRLVLTGVYSETLHSIIAQRVNYPVERIDYTSIISSSFKDEYLLDCCSVAIGLALRGEYKRPKK